MQFCFLVLLSVSIPSVLACHTRVTKNDRVPVLCITGRSAVFFSCNADVTVFFCLERTFPL